MVEPASSGTSPPSSGGGITQSPGNSNHVYLSDGTFLDFDELFDSAKQAAQSTPATSPVRQQESDYSPPMDASFINNSNRTADERELMTFVDQYLAIHTSTWARTFDYPILGYFSDLALKTAFEYSADKISKLKLQYGGPQSLIGWHEMLRDPVWPKDVTRAEAEQRLDDILGVGHMLSGMVGSERKQKQQREVSASSMTKDEPIPEGEFDDIEAEIEAMEQARARGEWLSSDSD